jgi:hypothetical protein
MQQPKPLNISIDKTTPVVCGDCSNPTFMEALMLRKVSKFITGQSQDALTPISVFLCTECGAVNKELLPPELLNQLTKEEDGE